MGHGLKLTGSAKIIEVKPTQTQHTGRVLRLTATWLQYRQTGVVQQRADLWAIAWGKYMCDQIDKFNPGDDVSIAASPRFEKNNIDQAGLAFTLHDIRPCMAARFNMKSGDEMQHSLWLSGCAKVTRKEHIEAKHPGRTLSLMALNAAQKDGNIFYAQTYLSAKAWGKYTCDRIDAVNIGDDVQLLATPQLEEFVGKQGDKRSQLAFNILQIEPDGKSAAAPQATQGDAYLASQPDMESVPF